ncbi:MAG: hypothetical protein II885_07040 [Oscillospiraceae bacterium]|nr:hypothetical protein [Oscillospiraceae bacterium]
MRGYEKLPISFPIPRELDAAIDCFVNHINIESGTSEDCYRSEIEFWLKDAQRKLTPEQFDTLKCYYVLGGIYSTIGYPWDVDKYHISNDA